MNNVFVLENINEDDNQDKLLFGWAKKVEELGYEVSNIWESDYKEEDNANKGINFTYDSSTIEGIYLCVNDYCIYVEIDSDAIVKQEYVKFLGGLIGE